jgi:hypothetical protein
VLRACTNKPRLQALGRAIPHTDMDSWPYILRD